MQLIKFIETEIAQKAIDEDLNTLLPPANFRTIRQTLKTETLIFLRTEMGKLNTNKN